MKSINFTRCNLQQLKNFQRFYATTRKKPLDPSHENTLPIFQYPISKVSDRRVYVWGLAETGALGIHMPRSSKMKKKYNDISFAWSPIRSSFAEKFDVTHTACGYGFTVMAVKTDEKFKVFGCGINTDSQIGYHAPRIGHPLELLLYPAPILLPLHSKDTVVTGLAAGRAHLLVLTNNEGVFTLGNNAYGQCGRKINTNEVYKGNVSIHNIKTLGKEKITGICCGQDHSLFVTEGGHVYSCGWGADGQTGLGCYESQARPTLLAGDISREKIVKLSSAGDCVLALSECGEVFGWGNAEYGQVPCSDGAQQVGSPRALRAVTRGLGRVVDVAAGGSFCMLLNDQGDVFVWGFGLLGLGPKVQYTPKPTLIPPPLFGRNEFSPDSTVSKISCGISHLAAISNKGDLYTWGRNKHGCLGLGFSNDQHFPLKVSIGASVLDVSCGVDHTLAFCKPFV